MARLKTAYREPQAEPEPSSPVESAEQAQDPEPATQATQDYPDASGVLREQIAAAKRAEEIQRQRRS
jgi:hypothetical protein